MFWGLSRVASVNNTQKFLKTQVKYIRCFRTFWIVCDGIRGYRGLYNIETWLAIFTSVEPRIATHTHHGRFVAILFSYRAPSRKFTLLKTVLHWGNTRVLEIQSWRVNDSPFAIHAFQWGPHNSMQLLFQTGDIEMNTGRSLITKQSFFITLIVATFFALSASFGSMVLDQVAGTQLTESASACHGTPGGC